MSGWQAVIGLELHVQLATRRKLFSAASTVYGAAPNSQVAWVDAGLPGALPVANAEAVRMAVRFGLAVDAQIARRSLFARKHYFYPDLPKGYQITQSDAPIVIGGALHIATPDGRSLALELIRAHLEEDAGKSVHDAFAGVTAIDLNRAGTPLIEIVTAPCLHSAADAALAMRTVHQLVVWLGICDGNLEQGSLRCDANVSVRWSPQAALGTRCEIKNLNSFRFIEKAIDYEIERQIRELEAGRAIRQETRLFDETRQSTRPMRGKEDAHDYRYFPDPDLAPLLVDAALLASVRNALPELPAARRARYAKDFALSAQDLDWLCAERALGDYFDAVLEALGEQSPARAKLAVNWMAGELAAALNQAQLGLGANPVSPAALAGLLAELEAERVNGKVAKEVFAAIWRGEGAAAEIIDARGLAQVDDAAALTAAIDALLAAHPQQVAQYRAGDDKVFGWLVGQAMKATQGKANPARLNQLLRQRLTPG